MRTLAVLFLACLLPAGAASDPFFTKPYIQLGRDPLKDLALLWHTADRDAQFTVETRVSRQGKWSGPVKATFRKVAVQGIEPHRVWTAVLRGLKPGIEFEYRILESGQPVFNAAAKSRKSARQPYRFVVFGDCAQDTPEQRKVAFQAYQAKPDFLFITGDIVYSRGQASEYRTKYFPIYNADSPDPNTGAPLLRSTPFISSPGNHDILTKDFAKYPDTQAYFYYWNQPLNGPLGQPGKYTPSNEGPEAAVKAFRDAAGEAYPRMANFSFDYGNAHWTVLDANPYTDWNAPELRDWVVQDLAKAQKATWRFVAFHQPGFNSSVAHFKEQYMRVLAPVFEKGKVDIVFNGHVHNYQRSFPTFYDPASSKWTLDKKFDGKSATKPNGVIYIVTGGGGARLYNPEQQDDPKSWQGFTDKFISKVNSMTVVDAAAKQLAIKQVDLNGNELDRFVVTR